MVFFAADGQHLGAVFFGNQVFGKAECSKYSATTL